jgi:L-cysteine/cystine lyase
MKQGGSTVGSEPKIAMIREQMPAVTRYVYLNTGTFGPLPRIAVEAMESCQQVELTEGRIVPSGYAFGRESKGEAREAFASILGCSLANVALTRHTTDGINIGVMGLNWQPGDEIVISDLEHPGAQGAVYTVGRRFGVTVRLARLGTGAGDVLGAFERVISWRTRMIVVSHLTWNTGAVLPLKSLVELAHRHHVLVVVDGAQSAGAIPVDVTDLGVDVYAIPGQKWLCGPEESGAVYVSDEAIEQIQPLITGYASVAPGGWEYVGGYLLPKSGAGRYEVSGVNLPKTVGQTASLTWIRDVVGLDWTYARIAGLGRYAAERLEAIDDVTVVTPREQMAGLVSFAVEGTEPSALVERLGEQDIIIRSLPSPQCVRVSTGFYNTREDIDRLVEVVGEMRRAL